MSNIAAISMGTNIEPRMGYLEQAIQLLGGSGDIEILSVSSVYETDPVGYEKQDCFLNLVLIVQTSLTPANLLIRTQAVENTLGRERLIRWGPRTIDLDILLYNKENVKTESLEIPHPRMSERAFVGIPLMEAYNKVHSTIEDKLKVPELNLVDEGIRMFKENCKGEGTSLF